MQVLEVAEELMSSGPQAIAESKKLLRMLGKFDPKGVRMFTTQKIADVRAGEEAKEGFSAFLNKRKPSWTK